MRNYIEIIRLQIEELTEVLDQCDILKSKILTLEHDKEKLSEKIEDLTFSCKSLSEHNRRLNIELTGREPNPNQGLIGVNVG